MAENRDEQHKHDSQEYEFVKERIIERPKKKTNFFIRLIGMLILGMAFGGVGAVAFTFALPYAQKMVETKENMTFPGDEVIIPKDDEITSSSDEEMTPAESSAYYEKQSTEDESVTTEMTTGSVQEILTKDDVLTLIHKALDEKQLDLTDYQQLFSSMFSLVSDVNKSVVTITSVKNSTDIMNNPYEESENTSGIIYNITENTVFILTNWDGVKSADFIRVSFSNGFSCDAAVRMYDVGSNMAVICVDTVLFDEYSLSKLKAVSLGNSYNVRQGDLIIAVGNPMGYMYTMSYGVVTIAKNSLQSIDAMYRCLDTNAIKSNDGNGFLINLEGELVGLILSTDADTENSNIVTALALSDLKGRLEVISNNREVAYMGIMGQDITSDIAASQGLPQGIYVSQIIIDSPAYVAGIRNGDIIVGMANMNSMSMNSFRNYLESAYVGDAVTVTVMRKGKSGYTEISLEVTFGAYK